MAGESFDKPKVVGILNRILELELAGMVRYTHYSFMVFGFGRIPIVKWLRAQAQEGLIHAQQAGELITDLGEQPSLGIGPILEGHTDEIAAILEESLKFEQSGLEAYRELLRAVDGKSVSLEEYARRLIAEEEHHVGEVSKMLRRPGDLGTRG